MRPSLSFEHYLHKMGHTKKTVASYLFDHKTFLLDHPQPEHLTYKDIMNYLGEKKKIYSNENTCRRLLSAIKKYYDYLIEIGVREDHPCKTFHLNSRRKKGVIHQDLFTSAELELLLDREERYEALRFKNLALTSILIYQGLTSGELAQLKVNHVELDKGLIYVKGSKNMAHRHVEIQPKQYRILDRYLTESRKELLRIETDNLLVGKLGTPITTDDVQYIISTMKGLFPDRNLTPQTIRQSVIANWLNEKKIPLEQVQLMSGQKWISTTLKYRQNNSEEQRELMNKFFPI